MQNQTPAPFDKIRFGMSLQLVSRRRELAFPLGRKIPMAKITDSHLNNAIAALAAISANGRSHQGEGLAVRLADKLAVRLVAIAI